MPHDYFQPDAIRQARLRKGLTQEAAADAIGVSQGYLSKLERLQLQPRRPVARALREVLDIDFDALSEGLAEWCVPTADESTTPTD